MKTVRFLASTLFLIMMLVLLAGYPRYAYASDHDTIIREWQIAWIDEQGSSSDTKPPVNVNWLNSGSDNPITAIPDGSIGMWVRLPVPPTDGWDRPGLLVDRLYGLELAVYRGNELLFESRRSFAYDLNKLVLPVERYSEPTDFYIRIVSTRGRAGLITSALIGDFDNLAERYVRKELPNLMLGASIVFLGLIMLICSGYLNRKLRRSWMSLCLVALAIGTLIFTYSPMTFILFKDYANVLLILFDLSMFVLFPALHSYIDQIFEEKFSLFTKFGRFLSAYALFCAAFMIINKSTGARYAEFYKLCSVTIWGSLILLLMLFIVMLSVRNAVKRNRDSLLLSIGFFLLAVSGAADLTLYYASNSIYILFLWKFGVVILIATLIIILAKRIMADHQKVIAYSKELELYNHKLLHSEKMKIISDLAASVAHEIRNPLQVTRGFLQLLSERTDDKNKYYIEMAISELDRASAIITDFLTFAKPEMETMTTLDLAEEIRKIEAIMTPLASMQGGVLRINMGENLYIHGNSSKFKQAFINFIKNSVEALQTEGIIEIEAYSQEDEVVIHIRDNGEGMEDDELSKLGVPFFSTKTKGTGLGLMVSLRIITAMEGKTTFHSVKGKGTEITIRFPLATLDHSLPNFVRT